MSLASDRREAAKAATRAQLLGAAALVFGRRGYEAASLREVADEAGFTTGALYVHFAGKEDLFLAVMDQRMAAQIDAFNTLVAISSADEVLDRLQSWFELGPAEDRTWGLLALEFTLYARRHPDVLAKLVEHRRHARDALASMIGTAFAQFAVDPPRPPRDLAELALALGNGLSEAIHLNADVPPDLFSYGISRIMTPEAANPRAAR